METRYLHRFLLIILSICAGLNSPAQIYPAKIEQIDSLMAHKPKPLLVLISTDWCQYCTMQKQQIHKNKKFAQQTTAFYFIEFNAERKDPLLFKNQKYHYKPNGINTGIHELAIVLNGNPKISYPTWVLLDAQFTPIFKHNGLLNATQIDKLLTAMTETFKNN